MRKISIFVFSFVLVIASTSLFGTSPNAIRGILDLRNKSEITSSISLSGQWEFYWKKLLTPDDFQNKITPDTYAKVPSYWTSYIDDIPEITGFGYGTYRLKVIFPANFRDSLCLKIPIFDSSYKLFLNGKNVAGNGKVGTTKKSSRPEYDPDFYSFFNQKDTLEIVVQVSNFYHRKGGFWLSMFLGEKNQMLKKGERKEVVDYALIGILIATFFFFFISYFIDRKNIIFLFFSLSTLGILIRLLNTGLYPIYFISNQNWIWTIRFEYLGTFIAYVFGFLYLDQIFPSKRMHLFSRINGLLFFFLALLVIVSGPQVFSYTMPVLEFLGALFFLFYIYISFKGMLRGNILDTGFFISVLVFLLAVINDSLVSYSLSPLDFDYLLPIVFLLFIFEQAMMLMTQWVKSLQEKARMHLELQNINKNLEKIITKRTEELKSANVKLQNSLDFKNKLYSIIAHDLKSPVATLAQYSELLSSEYPDSPLVSDFQELAFSSIDLIDNLLHWGKNQESGLQYNPELIDLGSIFTEMKSHFAYHLNNKNISFSLSIPGKVSAYADPELVKIILRNLINNSIKFTAKNGNISLSAESGNGKTTVTLSDSGIGMTQKTINQILSNEIVSKTGTENERGTGIGFMVVNDMIKISRGSLTIKSEPGKGTTVAFTLPGKP